MHLAKLKSDWKYRQNWKNGLALLSFNLFKSGLRLCDLFLVPRLFVRYMVATFFLHVVYEVVKRFREYFVRLSLQSTAKGRKIISFRKQLSKARLFQERQAIGLALDQIEGKDEWKNEPSSPYIDCERVINKTQMYKRLMVENDIVGLMFYLRAGLLRKHWGLGNPRLYGYTHVGTKKVIEDYMSTITESMDAVLRAQPTGLDQDEELSVDNKLAFFNETRHAFGRSALCLSGGGALGIYHAGVVKV